LLGDVSLCEASPCLRKRDWLLSEKVETFFSDTLFYVFVNLPDETTGLEYFVVPSKEVAVYAKEFNQKWLATPDRKGQQHKDNSL